MLHVMVCGSSICYPLILCGSTSLLMTSRSIPGWSGNFAINKNHIPFCAIGADHALKHINHIMKVTGGLVSIRQNASAMSDFSLQLQSKLMAILEELPNKAGGDQQHPMKLLHCHQER